MPVRARSELHRGATPRDAALIMITAARNEAHHLHRLIDSVGDQTRLPDLWVVVDDGSTDETSAVLRAAGERLPWLHVIILPPRDGRSFSGKAQAINLGWEEGCRRWDLSAKGSPAAHVGYVACIDADVVLPPSFLADTTAALCDTPHLGLTGARYWQTEARGRRRADGGPAHFVPGLAQVFRRSVFDDIGGYRPLTRGGVDSVAVLAVRAHGWTTAVVPDLWVEHLREEGSANWQHTLPRLRGRGLRDYDAGNLLAFEVLKLMRRVTERPYLVGSMVRLWGYAWAALRRIEREADPRAVQQLRHEQRTLLRSFGRHHGRPQP